MKVLPSKTREATQLMAYDEFHMFGEKNLPKMKVSPKVLPTLGIPPKTMCHSL